MSRNSSSGIAERDRTATQRSWRRGVIQFAPIIAGACVAVTIITAWGVARFGTPAAAMAYMGGERLLVTPSVATFAPGSPGVERRINVTFRNLGKRSIKVLGSKSSCVCVAAWGLPVVVPPRGEATVPVTVKLLEGFSEINQRVVFVTDAPGTSARVVEVRGFVLEE